MSNTEVSANKGTGISVSNNSSFRLGSAVIKNNLGDGISLSENSVGQFWYIIFPISMITNHVTRQSENCGGLAGQ